MAVNWGALNWVDWAIILVLGISILLSLWRGFVREALSLAAWVAAFFAASLFANVVAELLAGVVDNVTARFVVAYVLLFVGTLILGGLINRVMGKLVKLTGLSGLDRLLGTVFGFTRGLIIVLVVVFVVQELIPAHEQQALRESQLMPQLEMLVQWLRSSFDKLNAGWASGISI